MAKGRIIILAIAVVLACASVTRAADAADATPATSKAAAKAAMAAAVAGKHGKPGGGGGGEGELTSVVATYSALTLVEVSLADVGLLSKPNLVIKPGSSLFTIGGQAAFGITAAGTTPGGADLALTGNALFVVDTLGERVKQPLVKLSGSALDLESVTVKGSLLQFISTVTPATRIVDYPARTKVSFAPTGCVFEVDIVSSGVGTLCEIEYVGTLQPFSFGNLFSTLRGLTAPLVELDYTCVVTSGPTFTPIVANGCDSVQP